MKGTVFQSIPGYGTGERHFQKELQAAKMNSREEDPDTHQYVIPDEFAELDTSMHTTTTMKIRLRLRTVEAEQGPDASAQPRSQRPATWEARL